MDPFIVPDFCQRFSQGSDVINLGPEFSWQAVICHNLVDLVFGHVSQKESSRGGFVDICKAKCLWSYLDTLLAVDLGENKPPALSQDYQQDCFVYFFCQGFHGYFSNGDEILAIRPLF